MGGASEDKSYSSNKLVPGCWLRSSHRIMSGVVTKG